MFSDTCNKVAHKTKHPLKTESFENSSIYEMSCCNCNAIMAKTQKPTNTLYREHVSYLKCSINVISCVSFKF